jgi:hypothetical protein
MGRRSRRAARRAHRLVAHVANVADGLGEFGVGLQSRRGCVVRFVASASLLSVCCGREVLLLDCR